MQALSTNQDLDGDNSRLLNSTSTALCNRVPNKYRLIVFQITFESNVISAWIVYRGKFSFEWMKLRIYDLVGLKAAVDGATLCLFQQPATLPAETWVSIQTPICEWIQVIKTHRLWLIKYLCFYQMWINICLESQWILFVSQQIAIFDKWEWIHTFTNKCVECLHIFVKQDVTYLCNVSLLNANSTENL